MLEEARENYKSLRSSTRIGIMVLLGLLPAGYVYYTEVLTISEQLEVAQQTKTAETKKYQDAKKKKEELPKLEERFATVTEELRKAQEKLPSKFHMDDILHSTASVAKEIGVKMMSFKPSAERMVAGAHRYAELPIKLNLIGKYNQIINFFDSIVNLEKIVHLRNISLKANRQGGPASNAGLILINTDVDLIVFRSSS